MTTINLTPELMAAAMAIVNAADAAQATTEPAPDKYTVLGENIELPSKMTKPLLSEFKAAEKAYAEAKQRFEDAKTALADAMDYHEVLVVEETGQIIAENRVTVAMVLDTAKIKKENPELVAKYQRERRSRGLRVLV